MTTFRTLTVSFGGNVLMTSTLSKSPYAIGELPNSDLPLPDISPSHAEIRVIAGRAFLTDLGSQLGTLVAGVLLLPHQPQLLVDGAAIRIGPYDIVYRSAIDEAGDGIPAAEEPAVAPQVENEPELAGVAIDPVLRRVRAPGAENGSFAIGRYLPYLPVIFHGEGDDTLTVSRNTERLTTSPVVRSPFSIGSAPASDLRLTDLAPSHAEVVLRSGRAYLRDCAGADATFVGNTPLQADRLHLLEHGATIRLGPYDVVYHSAPFLTRFLKIFESIWEPLEQRQDYIDLFFNPRTCPSSWLPWLASWFGLDLDPSLSEPRVRLLLANTIEIYRWRGTKFGLTRVIEVCLGIRPHITEHPAEANVFRVRIRLPADATPDFVPRLKALISAHKPAHTGYVIEVQK